MEATALLYLQRKYGSGYGNYKNSPRDNDVFITELSRIEGRKFSFGHNIVKRVMEQIKGDIDWISDRLSLDILEKDDKSNDGVDSEDELIDIAFNARKKLIDILILERATQNCDLEKLCDILDTFKKNISTPEAHLPLETVLFGGGHTSEIAKEIKSIESAVDVDILRVLTERLLAVGEREAALIVIQCALKLRPNGPRLKEIYSTLVNPC
ncbi:hypothetical protein WH50_07150 [Pokkaliibacter plantistimulans]|uniref:Uncharacterized protein n=2 Tax=Pokkaliibacter plantistimulans TaxID=1635171 RepID=A0ABX5LZB7_9GAMM|nr:hypothetical protein WH50_07150 [Pokkaliibacter plantistimulans]